MENTLKTQKLAGESVGDVTAWWVQPGMTVSFNTDNGEVSGTITEAHGEEDGPFSSLGTPMRVVVTVGGTTYALVPSHPVRVSAGRDLAKRLF